MRRIRQTSPGLTPAAFSRLSAAVALSVALHFFLIYGVSLPTQLSPGVRNSIIYARLASPAPGARTPPAAPARGKLPAFVRSMPAQLPAPAQNALPEPPADPDPVEVRSDPEPVVAAAAGPAEFDFPDTVHYAAKDLDVYPQAVKPLTPAYPETARDAKISGFVTLQVLVDESGRVVGTSLVDAAPGGVFEQAAEKAVVDALFYPARKDGRPVRSRILVKIEFEPTGDAP